MGTLVSGTYLLQVVQVLQIVTMLLYIISSDYLVPPKVEPLAAFHMIFGEICKYHLEPDCLANVLSMADKWQIIVTSFREIETC